jgi:hypothetical protein
MTIQIKRNNAGNCITFVGSSKPVYFNSCLSGRVNPDDSSRIDIINDINTTDVNNPAFEFFAVDYTLFRDADNNSFATAQEAADYITAQGNTIGNTGTFELQGHNSLSFTKTTDGLTVLVDNGDAHALETLSARVDQNDNTKLEITNHTASRVLYSNITPSNVLYDNSLLLTGSINDMVNQLNAYFNGQPLTSAVSEGVITQLSGGEYVTFWYIENNPNTFTYPLFKNSEDADLVADDMGNSGHTTIVFPSDPTNTTWYLPNGGSSSVNTDPTGLIYTIDGVTPNWNEQNAQYPAPAAFTDTTVTVDELSAVNVQVQPQGATWTTTITNLDGSNFTLLNGYTVNGIAPEVLQDNVANPYDDYRVTITRTNAHGSSTGTLTIRVTNLTAPVVQAINGFTWEPTSTAMIDDDRLEAGSVVGIDDLVNDGRRLIITQSWIETNVLPNLSETNDQCIIGINRTTPSVVTSWSNLDIGLFDVHIKLEWTGSNSHISSIGASGSNTSNVSISSLTDAYYDYAFEVDGTSVHVIACNFNDINTQHSVNDGGTFSRTASKTVSAGNKTVSIGARNTTIDLATSGLSEIDIPATPVTNTTDFDKAVDFSGGNEYLKLASTITPACAIRMQGLGNTVAPHSSQGSFSTDSGLTSDHTYSRPWACSVIFKSDGNNSNQHIWNNGEGAGTTDDNIYLRLSSTGTLHFGWGRSGATNEFTLATNISSSNWYGVYIGHTGARYSGAQATAGNLAAAFDVHMMDSSDGFTSLSSNLSTSTNWSYVNGARMDRSVIGDFTIGGRGNNRNFHGKVASMVITTLRRGVNMPSSEEIKLMISDPKKWEQDYRVGQTVRSSSNASEGTYSTSSSTLGWLGTQIWLMGDGTNDSYSNGIRNQVNPNDTSYTRLLFNSMLSNDIQNISINGLS